MSHYRIEVAIPERSYPIEIAPNLLAAPYALDMLAQLAGKSRSCLITHPTLKERYAAPLLAGLAQRGIFPEIIVIPSGEHRKNLQTVSRLYSQFLKAKLDRKSLVIALGGGVLGDMTGFAAATYLRGIRFVQIPTTLLSQVDASVGGKTGVDLPDGKNLIGAFHQPSAVLIDTNTLASLPARELRSGLAEVIKYGIIYDNAFFNQIREDSPALLRREPAALARAIARSCEIKADVVMQDETEQGLRAILNFGHTIGHALEAATQYRRYKHGEAIAIGMIAESRIGEHMGQTAPEVTQALREALLAVKLPVDFPADISAETILEIGQRDKKTIGGLLRFITPICIGSVEVRADVPDSIVREALRSITPE